MDVEIRELPGFRTAAVRHVGPYHRIGEAFERLGEVAGRAGLMAGGSMLGVYHDDPESTPAAELRSDAALIVSEDATIPDELSEILIAPGRYAMAVHRGSYEGLGDAWARLMGQWLPQSDERVGDGVSLEIYRTTPDQVAEADLVTELYVPLVAPRG